MLKRLWEPFEYEIEGSGPLKMELRRLTFAEKTTLSSMFLKAHAAMGPEPPEAPKGATDAELMNSRRVKAEWLNRFYSALDPIQVADFFRDTVRNVKGLESEEGPITTGEGLFAFADESMVTALLGQLRVMSNLNVTEGKGSGSPSTSTSAPATGDGDSDAKATGREDGVRPSTVTAIRVGAA